MDDRTYAKLLTETIFLGFIVCFTTYGCNYNELNLKNSNKNRDTESELVEFRNVEEIEQLKRSCFVIEAGYKYALVNGIRCASADETLSTFHAEFDRDEFPSGVFLDWQEPAHFPIRQRVIDECRILGIDLHESVIGSNTAVGSHHELLLNRLVR